MSTWDGDWDNDKINDETEGGMPWRQDDGVQGTEPAPRLYYGSVDEFVRDYLRHVYRRRIDGRHRCWAGRWWAYAEAIERLEALWRAWEQMRQDAGVGKSEWWRDHADYHMAVLMDPDGPFATATEGAENTSRKGEPLPYVAPPEGMFQDARGEGGTAGAGGAHGAQDDVDAAGDQD